MNPQTRNLLIQRIVDSLAVVGPGSVFERFAVVLVERMLGVSLVQRGSSIGGSPVGGALDATSADGRIAVEASIRKDYFVGDMKKPGGDLKHMLALAPLVEDAYLLCSRRAETGVIEAFNVEVAKRAEMVGRRLHLFDGRRIAEVIVDDLLLLDEAIDALSQHLPVLSDIRDDHPASLLAPPLSPLYVAHEEVDQELDRRLENDVCVEICGIGGIGKSQAAAACLARHRDRYDYAYWISGRDVERIELLSSVHLRRGGAERNVAAIMRKGSAFIVLDDASDAMTAQALVDMCGPNSRVLVTRRGGPPTAYSLPMFDEALSLELLGKDLDIQPSDADFRVIWGAVGGHPLSLGLVNAAARAGVPWEDLASDCASIGRLPDGGTLLADRILGRLRPLLGDELSVFVWAGQSHCDRAFLRSVVGPIAFANFERFGVTAPESAGAVRIHDIVFTALGVRDWLTAGRSARIDDELERFIVGHVRNDGNFVQRIASQLRRKIARIVEDGDRRPAFLYALAVVWSGSAVRVDLLPEPVEMAAELAGRQAHHHEIEILVVLETIEARGRHMRQQSGWHVAEEWLEAALPAYERLLSMKGLSRRQVAEIRHHRAKTLKAVKGYRDAEAEFRAVIADFPLPDSKLQLARIVSRRADGHEEARRLALDIVEEHARKRGVSSSTLMALGDLLNGNRATWAADVLANHEELFLNEALYAAASGVSQGYHSIASFVRALVWHAPERVSEVLERLPEPTPLLMDDDQSRAGFAEIMFHAATAGPEELYLPKALEAYEALSAPDDYQKRKWGETLYRLGRLDDAEDLLETVSDESGRIWLTHNLSQVKLAKGELQLALTLVDESVAGAVGADRKYRSSFLLQRAKVRLAMGEDPSDDIAEGRLETDHSGLLRVFDEIERQHADD